jgi:hypothetical protein
MKGWSAASGSRQRCSATSSLILAVFRVVAQRFSILETSAMVASGVPSSCAAAAEPSSRQMLFACSTSSVAASALASRRALGDASIDGGEGD